MTQSPPPSSAVRSNCSSISCGPHGSPPYGKAGQSVPYRTASSPLRPSEKVDQRHNCDLQIFLSSEMNLKQQNNVQDSKEQSQKSSHRSSPKIQIQEQKSAASSHKCSPSQKPKNPSKSRSPQHYSGTARAHDLHHLMRHSIDRELLSPASQADLLPRLNFASKFIPDILNGVKTATTRLYGEKDPASDLANLHVGTRCVATSADDASVFAHLVIKRIQTKTVDQIDDELAHIENCVDAQHLRDVLKEFYPNVQETDLMKVYYFELRKFGVSKEVQHKKIQQTFEDTQVLQINKVNKDPKKQKLDFGGKYGQHYFAQQDAKKEKLLNSSRHSIHLLSPTSAATFLKQQNIQLAQAAKKRKEIQSEVKSKKFLPSQVVNYAMYSASPKTTSIKQTPQSLQVRESPSKSDTIDSIINNCDSVQKSLQQSFDYLKVTTCNNNKYQSDHKVVAQTNNNLQSRMQRRVLEAPQKQVKFTEPGRQSNHQDQDSEQMAHSCGLALNTSVKSISMSRDRSTSSVKKLLDPVLRSPAAKRIKEHIPYHPHNSNKACQGGKWCVCGRVIKKKNEDLFNQTVVLTPKRFK